MSEKHQGFMKALKCRECGREYPLEATHVCEFDFGPLEVAYDYDRIKKSLTRATIESRPKTMWRYRELLPIAANPPLARSSASRRSSKRTGSLKPLHPRTLGQKRRRQLPYPVVQRPRRQCRLEPREGTWL